MTSALCSAARFKIIILIIYLSVYTAQSTVDLCLINFVVTEYVS